MNLLFRRMWIDRPLCQKGFTVNPRQLERVALLRNLAAEKLAARETMIAASEQLKVNGMLSE